MESNKGAFESRRLELQKQLSADRENLQSVLDLLKKADERYKAEPANRAMWNRVLNNLERSLVEIRARVQSSEIALKKFEAEFRETAAFLAPAKPVAEVNAESMPPADADALESADRDPTLLSMDAARRILARPVEEIADLTLQDVALLYDAVAGENVAAAVPEDSQLMATLELANQIGAQSPAESMESFQQTALRVAIEKIQNNQINTMTPAEERLTFACYELLSRRVRRTPKDERLRRILGAAIQILNRKRTKTRKDSAP